MSYERIRRKKGEQKAIVACMRKRLVTAFHILRKKAYQFNALSDTASKVLDE